MLKKISSYVIVLAIGGVLGTYFDVGRTIEEKIVTKDRTRTIVREVVTEKPDGTKITERVTDKKEKSDTKVAKKESIPVKKNWGVGVKVDLFSPVSVYTAEIHRRVFSELYLSAYGRTDGQLGVGVTFFF